MQSTKTLIVKQKDTTTIDLCGKINGAFLKKNGIDSALVDLLHGRLPRSVFQRHYLKSGLSLAKIDKVVNELWGNISPLVK